MTEATLSWSDLLAEEKEKSYFLAALSYVNEARRSGKTIYPAKENTFYALTATPLDKVKVVIIGQDPYHGPNQAHGLCFSVQKGVPAPPSLQNMFKELHRDCGIPLPSHGCLEKWAKQGVLLLNTILTVEHGKAHSHADIGWESFTDQVIKTISEHRNGIIFLLWGSHAQKKSRLIDIRKHHVLKSTHPSPLSAHRGFLGCGHFSQVNHILEKAGQDKIDWQLDD